MMRVLAWGLSQASRPLRSLTALALAAFVALVTVGVFAVAPSAETIAVAANPQWQVSATYPSSPIPSNIACPSISVC